MEHNYNYRSSSNPSVFILNLRFTYRLLISGLLLVISGTKIFAQGDLLISPLRIVFDGNKKSQEINLANVGKDTAVYSISIVDIRMKEDGAFEEIKVPDSGQNFAGPYLRFFPRKVTLAPNEAQVVKIQLVKASQLSAGEYRSHLYFRAEPEERPQGAAPSKKDSGISIQLTPVFGITIPVIIRTGACSSDVTFSDLAFNMVDSKPENKDEKIPTLSLTFNRTGNISVYGELKVNYISPSGKTTQVKIVKGIGIYTPNALRHSKVELDNDKNIDYRKGKLQVIYSLQTSDKSVKTVEGEVILK